MINVTSKNTKNTANDLNHMQSNNRNTISTSTLKQCFSSIDLDLKKKWIKKILLNKTLNINLNMSFVFDNYNFKNNVVNLTQTV